jgi:SAM-dependent methyltransferase
VVLDAGCGTGADLAGLVAAVPQGRVVAIDTAEPFIAGIRARWPAQRAEVADMADPPGGPFDLIWAAGSIYNLGVGAALEAWRPHLAPGGRVAFSDLCWTRSARPAAVAAFFAAEGVVPVGPDDLVGGVRAAGWRVLAERWLGPEAWAAYYLPLEVRLDGFAGNPALIAAFRTEIGLWRGQGASFGCRLLVVEPA